MNKWIAGLFAAALCATPAIADIGAPAPTAKDLSKYVDEVNFVETAKSGVVLSGYVDVGYTYNFIGGGSRVANRFPSDGLPKGDFNLNAVKLALEKPLTDANEFQAGFRVDLMFGEDAVGLGGQNGTFGNTVVGTGVGSSDDLLVQQAYIQLRAPLGNGVDIKAGKFVTWLGYEVMERPSNLNITYGNLFQNMIPLWHLGVSAEYAFNDIVDGGIALVNGFNSDTNFGTANTGLGAEDGYGVMAKVNFTAPGGNANWFHSIYAGFNDGGFYNSGAPVLGGISETSHDVFIYDTWGNWVPKFANDKLLLAFNASIGTAGEQFGIFTPGDRGSNTWWGAALYAKYQFTDIFSLAARADYIHTDDSGGKFGALGDGTNEDLWSWTLTAGFDLLENLLLRAEYRVDFGNDTTAAPLGGFAGVGSTSDSAHTVALQAVYTF